MPGQAQRPLDVAYLATQGTGSQDEQRIASLLAPLGARPIAFDRGARLRSALRAVRSVLRSRPDVLVLEGTGIAGGAVCLACRALGGTRYVVSSGDAVGPYLRMLHAALALAGPVYERLLTRGSAGFIGWSPYLAGRALQLGAPRAMSAANWAEVAVRDGDRERVRARLGIPEDALVVGLVGSLNWSPRRGYCYGLELVRAALRADRDDLVVLVIGDGSGRERLEREAGELLGRRILIPGPVPREDVGAHLAALDVASLPQSVDLVGALRYTTKLSEYLAAGVPVVTGELPFAYDLDDGWLWRIPGDAPWSERYVAALGRLMSELTPAEVAERREAVPTALPQFSLERQQRQVCAFVADVAAAGRT
jgi:glycosyltransferase involved in cell wall biosynthesis